MKKLIIMLMVVILTLSFFGCDTKNSNGKDDEFDYGDSSQWAGTEYVSKDLGLIYFDAFPDDYCYDWGFSTMFEDGKYKTWWVRPSAYDAIFYAESNDLKNWTNVKRVITLSPAPDRKTKYNFIKSMLGKPSVVHVGDTYYMYFEAPASEDPDVNATVQEWDNNVMLATSSDGIEWEFYCDEKGQPKPVIKMPEDAMGNISKKTYGVGQPSVFYKDGTFYVSYCYVIDDVHEIRLATSTDGLSFGNTSTHVKISESNGLGVKYNAKTDKYMILSTNEIKESKNISDWSNAKSYSFTKYSEGVATFPDFVTNGHGHITQETMYFIFTSGKASTTGDWRANHTTWDGHLVALLPCEYAKRTMTLPDGKPATEENLMTYKDKNTKLNKPVADAIYKGDSNIVIDCQKEDIYNNASKIEINRGVYEWGSNITKTHGEAYLAWDEDYLYGFIQIYDDEISYSNIIPNLVKMYNRDSIDIFIDVPNDHTLEDEIYGLDQYILCVGANNTDMIIKGADDYDMTSEFSVKQKRVKLTDDGYIVEFKLEWYEYVKDLIEEGTCIGMDFQINDDMGAGYREAMVVWSDHTGNSFRFVDKFGDVYLIKK